MTNKLQPKALILAGDGINCERETSWACDAAGFKSEIRHINDLISEKVSMSDLAQRYGVLALPGGFSFGDDLASGKVLALKMAHSLRWDLQKYVEMGGLVIGICNGFQALLRLGIFGKSVSITSNEGGRFINEWVGVETNGKRCVWLKGLGSLVLPIRHGEGRICFTQRDRDETLQKFHKHDQVCMRYERNPNGSDDRIAGLSDLTGRIFGLMPHPEAFIRWTAHPDWTQQSDRAGSPGQGLAIFENAFKEAKGSL